MKKIKRNLVTVFAVLSLGLAAAGCSSNAGGYDSSETPGMTDPLEDVNRAVFGFNRQFDSFVVYPIVEGYRFVVPSPARKGISNVLEHLQNPVHLANNVLQGDIQGAGRTAFRSVVNTFVGFGGVLDIAAYEGYEKVPADFGKTLASWGVNHGPYIVAPFFGPSSARDYAGYFVDSFMDPLRWYWFNIDEQHLYYTKMGVRYLDLRDSLKDSLQELESSSIDYYASVRSSYYQARKTTASDGDAAYIEYDN
jgi:phospholipid-binding lipoprotein MlaA